jgi:hypothetical protein
MPDTIQNLIQGAELSTAFDGSRAVVTSLVSDLPAAARSDPAVLYKALTAANLPILSQAWEADNRFRCTSIVARPGGNTNDSLVTHVYEGPALGGGTGGSGAVLIVEDDSHLVTEIEEVDPATGLAIQTQFTVKEDVIDSLSGYRTLRDSAPAVHTCPMPTLRPRRVISVTGIVVGRKQQAVWSQQAIGQVNESPWPSGSLFNGDSPYPRGYWLTTRVSARAERGILKVFDAPAMNYRVSASFESKVYRDHSQYGFHRNIRGQIPKEIAKYAADIKALIESPYEYGIKNLNNGGVNGFVRRGAFRLANFNGIFGF